jgi:hypothetical protein
MVRTSALIAFVGLAAASATASITVSHGDALVGDRSTNLIANGSFETGNSGVNVGWTPGTHLGGYPGTESVIPSWNAAWPTGAYGWWGPLGFAGAPAADGNNAVYFGNSFNTVGTTYTIGSDGVVNFAAAPSFSSRPGPVTLSQTVSGLTAGNSYRLDFWTSGEGNTGGFTGTGIFGVDVSGSGSAYLLLATSANSYGASERYYIDFVAASSSVTISFNNWGHITDMGGSSTELVLDDVILNTVPSPAPLALLGLGGLAAARRRR